MSARRWWGALYGVSVDTVDSAKPLRMVGNTRVAVIRKQIPLSNEGNTNPG